MSSYRTGIVPALSRTTLLALLALLLLLTLLTLPTLPALADRAEVRLRGRLMTRWEVDKEGDSWSNRFVLRRARLDGRWSLDRIARLELELETTDGVELKDAYAWFEGHPYIRLTAGHFKKPLSRLRLEPLHRLPLPERGLLDRHVIRRTTHGGFGNRDVGVMLSGHIRSLARLRYFVGGFSGPEFVQGSSESHQDIVGRLQVRPFKGLRLAINGNRKRYYLGERSEVAFLAGGDLRYKLKKFQLQLEGAYGDNVDIGPGHRLWGAHGLAFYRIPLGAHLKLIPAVMVELFDPDDEVPDGRVTRIGGALNLDLGNLFRLLVFAEGSVDQPLVTDPEQEGRATPLETDTRIMVQLNVNLAWSSRAPLPDEGPGTSP